METYEKPVRDKTLYVCVNNVGRSQMAENLHNHIQPGGAESAGLKVDDPEGRVDNWVGGAKVICDSMDELGLPIGQNTRTQYDPDIARSYAKTIFIISPEQWEEYEMPDILLLDKRIDHWPMDDPRDKPIEEVRMIRDQIHGSVKMLIERLVAVKPCYS